MNKIDAVLRRFPQYAYSLESLGDKSPSLGTGKLGFMQLGYGETALYKLLKSIVDEFNITMSNIDRVDRMLGIDTILPDDIYNRFGAMFGITQNKGETDEQYRTRLKTSITMLSGGTAEAVKYAIACGLGINNDPSAMDSIHIYDAWKYTGSANINRGYGYVVCEIDLNQGQYSVDMEKIVAESANNVKAAGVIIQFIYHNYRVVYYMELDNMTYASLDTSTYSQVGE